MIYTLTPVGHDDELLLLPTDADVGSNAATVVESEGDTVDSDTDVAQRVLAGVNVFAGEKYIEREEVYAIYPSGKQRLALEVRQVVM